MDARQPSQRGRLHRRLIPQSTRALEGIDAGEAPSELPLARLTAGGPPGNEILTGVTAALLLVLLAAEGVTIVRIRQLLSVHMLVGLVLIPMVGLKLASTGYRFFRYYTGSPPYRRKGPPAPLMRLSAPLLVLSTVVVLASGVVLLVAGPSSRDSLLPIHKISFFVWLAFAGVHLLGHLPGVPSALRADYGPRARGDGRPGREGRILAVAVALLAGVAVAALVALLVPEYVPWLHAHLGHHHPS